MRGYPSSWRWKQGSFLFRAEADTAHALDEITRKNNVLTFTTDAYTLAAYCEKGMAEKLDRINNWYGSYSHEDWLRGATVDAMNRLFTRSTYDFAPHGARISVRISKIYHVDKAEDSLQKKMPEYGTYDGAWMYPEGSVREYRNLANSFLSALVHELTHQIGIMDNYRYDLPPEKNRVNGKGYGQHNGGIMGGGRIYAHPWDSYADIDVAGMNRTYGFRRGFYGEYLYDIPKMSSLKLKVNGKPQSGVYVEVFQKRKGTEDIVAPPIQKGRTDGRGELLLVNRPVIREIVTATGCRLRPNPFGAIDVVGTNGLLLVRAKSGNRWHYGFMDIGRFVVAYAQGKKERATLYLELKPE